MTNKSLLTICSFLMTPSNSKQYWCRRDIGFAPISRQSFGRLYRLHSRSRASAPQPSIEDAGPLIRNPSRWEGTRRRWLRRARSLPNRFRARQKRAGWNLPIQRVAGQGMHALSSRGRGFNFRRCRDCWTPRDGNATPDPPHARFA